jgi:hypothetical protein
LGSFLADLPETQIEPKSIFGEIYLSDLAMQMRESGIPIKYILIAPFIWSKRCLLLRMSCQE